MANYSTSRDWVNKYTNEHKKHISKSESIDEDNKKDFKKRLRRMIDDNPDIFEEIMVDIRKEKILKIKSKM